MPRRRIIDPKCTTSVLINLTPNELARLRGYMMYKNMNGDEANLSTVGREAINFFLKHKEKEIMDEVGKIMNVGNEVTL